MHEGAQEQQAPDATAVRGLDGCFDQQVLIDGRSTLDSCCWRGFRRPWPPPGKIWSVSLGKVGKYGLLVGEVEFVARRSGHDVAEARARSRLTMAEPPCRGGRRQKITQVRCRSGMFSSPDGRGHAVPGNDFRSACCLALSRSAAIISAPSR